MACFSTILDVIKLFHFEKRLTHWKTVWIIFFYIWVWKITTKSHASAPLESMSYLKDEEQTLIVLLTKQTLLIMRTQVTIWQNFSPASKTKTLNRKRNMENLKGYQQNQYKLTKLKYLLEAPNLLHWFCGSFVSIVITMSTAVLWGITIAVKIWYARIESKQLYWKSILRAQRADNTSDKFYKERSRDTWCDR